MMEAVARTAKQKTAAASKCILKKYDCIFINSLGRKMMVARTANRPQAERPKRSNLDQGGLVKPGDLTGQTWGI